MADGRGIKLENSGLPDLTKSDSKLTLLSF
jgi:hypothetical protein